MSRNTHCLLCLNTNGLWYSVLDLSDPTPGPEGLDTKHLGKNFGKMGTVVTKPKGLEITGYSNHVLKKLKERGLTEKAAKSIVSKPMFVLEQRNGGAYAFVSGKGVVVLDKNGNVVTAWSVNDFDSNMLAMIEEMSK